MSPIDTQQPSTAPTRSKADRDSRLAVTIFPIVILAGLAGGIVLLAVVLHNGFGLGLGYLAGKIGRLDDKARRALAFEVGMQNSGLAATLAAAHFTPLAALPSAVFSMWHNLSGAVVAVWLARRPLPEGSPAAQETATATAQ